MSWKPAVWRSAFPEQCKTVEKKRKFIRRISASRQRDLLDYSMLRCAFMAKHKRCAVFCGLRAQEVHHVRGRNGGLLLDVRYWLAVSAKGHRWIHDNPKQAQEHGWLAGPGEWGKAGA